MIKIKKEKKRIRTETESKFVCFNLYFFDKLIQFMSIPQKLNQIESCPTLTSSPHNLVSI